MEMALTFNDVSLTPITYQNSPWIRAAELARDWAMDAKIRFRVFTAIMQTNSRRK